MLELDDRITKAVNVARTKLPPVPKVVDIRIEPYVDHLGDDSLKAWIILDDSTTDDDIVGGKAWKVKEVIRNSLLEQGVTLFVYPFLATESEYEEIMRELKGG